MVQPRDMTDEEVLGSIINGDAGYGTICKVHRLLYPLIMHNKDAVALLIKAHRMAKRMGAKLKQYKRGD